jgi:hypothetical protein
MQSFNPSKYQNSMVKKQWLEQHQERNNKMRWNNEDPQKSVKEL